MKIPVPLKSSKCATIRGNITVPGDKSISHRALMLSSIAIGRAKITGMLEGEDVIATYRALTALGIDIRREEKVWIVNGIGVGGLAEPDSVLDMGNSGTGARLLVGMVSSYAWNSFFSGDASLCRRPMARVIKPLEQMG